MSIAANSYLVARYPQSPWIPNALFGLADARQETGQYDAALATYDTLAGRFPQHQLAVEAYFRMGEIDLLHRHDLAGAVQCYTAVVKKLRPGSRTYDALFRLADCRIAEGNPDQALELYNQLERQAGTAKDVVGRVRFGRAMTLFLTGKFDDVRKIIGPLAVDQENLFQNDALRLAMVLEQGSPEELAVFARAQFCERRQQYGQAVAEWRRFLDTYPQSRIIDQATLNLVHVLLEQDLPQEALAACQTFVKKRPESPLVIEARIQIARIYEQHLKSASQAVAEYKKIIEDFPDSPQVPQVRKRLRELMKSI
jgi:TolA-binding protein